VTLLFETSLACFIVWDAYDNQIKVSGYRIELEEIDVALRQVSGRDLVGTVAWPIVDGAPKGIVGFIAGSPIDSAELTVALKQKLPPYMVTKSGHCSRNYSLKFEWQS